MNANKLLTRLLMVLATWVALAIVGMPPIAPSLARDDTTGADWPLYGADLSNSRCNPSGPSAVEAPSLGQVWHFDLSTSDFTGTPIVVAGRVFVGSNGGDVYALSAATGVPIWHRALGDPVNSSAAYADGRVYFAVARQGSPYVIALDANTGAIKWTTQLNDPIRQAKADVYSSPIVYRGQILVGTSAFFSEVGGKAQGTAGGVVRLNAATGQLVWRTITVSPGHDGGGVWSTAAVDPATNRVFVGTGNAYTGTADPHTDAILALDFATGQILSAFQATPNDTFQVPPPFDTTGPDYDFGASPNLFTLADGTRVVGEGQKSGIYWTLTRASLAPVWSTRVGPGSASGGVLGSTALSTSRIFGPITVPGEVWSVNRDGSIVWQTPSVADFFKYGPVSYSNGVVYQASSGGFLEAYGAQNGLPLTRIPLGEATFGGVSIASGTVYVSVGTGGVPGVTGPGPGSIQAFRASSRSPVSQGGQQTACSPSREPRSGNSMAAQQQAVAGSFANATLPTTSAGGLGASGWFALIFPAILIALAACLRRVRGRAR
jgi:polyvinyl alcohol dehydrogenase (cytochrome)